LLAAVTAVAALPAWAIAQQGDPPAASPSPSPPGPAGLEPKEAPANPLTELIRQGNAARQAGRIEEALGDYRKAEQMAPRLYEIRILIADTLRRSGRSAEAAAEYDAALALDPARPEAYAGRAFVRRASFDYDGAYAAAETGLWRVPVEVVPELLLVMAETRRRQGRLDEAALLFDRVLKAQPGSTPARAGLAQLAEERGDLDGALRGWDAYLEAKPEDDQAALRREELRELRASIETLRATAASSPSGPVYAELGRLLAVAGDAAGAAAIDRLSLRLNPDDGAARRGLALALRDAGDARGAATEFRRLLKAVPGDPVALYNLAALARSAGDAGGERVAWEALMRAHPDDLHAVRAFVLSLERVGEETLDRAIEAVGRAARKKPDPALYRCLALLQGAAGRWPEAAGALYGALTIDPTDPWTQAVGGELVFLHPELIQDLGARLRDDASRLSAAAQAAAGGDASGAAERAAAFGALAARLASWAGHPEEALGLARRAVAADPRSAVARSILTEAAQQVARDPAQEIEELTAAVALQPPRLADQIDLALALLRAGRARRAESAARAALATAPASAPALSVLGMALAEQGDFEAAADAYAAALRADPADNFGLASRQYPLMLATLGRNVEARRALRGDIPPLPEMLYRDAWAFVRDSYRDRGFNAQDWIAWRDRGRVLATLQEAYRAIAAMLASLGDPYTRLRDPEETAAIQLARRGERTSVDRLGRNRPGSKSVIGGELPGGLGYIRLTNFDDPQVVAQVRELLETMRAREGIVLDLRGNPGGFSRTADAISDMLIGPGRRAGADVGPDGATARITGGDGAITGAPVTVLVDGQTASAAERLARDLEVTGRGTIAGERTHGKGLAQASLVLPGGAMVLVSISEMLGPGDRPIQNRGLDPKSPAH
jgi:tetratricopeptide (TPR) repeat protein